jgi:hypothetical protein
MQSYAMLNHCDSFQFCESKRAHERIHNIYSCARLSTKASRPNAIHFQCTIFFVCGRGPIIHQQIVLSFPFEQLENAEFESKECHDHWYDFYEANPWINPKVVTLGSAGVLPSS